MLTQRTTRDYFPPALALAAYASLVLALLPSSDYLRMLGGAAILIAIAELVVRVTHDSPPSGFTVLIVSFVGAAVLVVPGFRAMGGRNGPALPIGFFGSQCISLLWATLIWRDSSRSPSRVQLRDALRFSWLSAVALSMFASVPIALMVYSDSAKARPYLLVYPGYFLGASAAAIIYWLLRSIAHRPVGLYIIGALAGTCMYTAVAPIVYLSKGDPIRVGEMLGIGLVCGFLAGPPVAISINDRAAT